MCGWLGHLIKFFPQLCEVADDPYFTDKKVNGQKGTDVSQSLTIEVQSQDFNLFVKWQSLFLESGFEQTAWAAYSRLTTGRVKKVTSASLSSIHVPVSNPLKACVQKWTCWVRVQSLGREVTRQSRKISSIEIIKLLDWNPYFLLG